MYLHGRIHRSGESNLNHRLQSRARRCIGQSADVWVCVCRLHSSFCGWRESQSCHALRWWRKAEQSRPHLHSPVSRNLRGSHRSGSGHHLWCCSLDPRLSSSLRQCRTEEARQVLCLCKTQRLEVCGCHSLFCAWCESHALRSWRWKLHKEWWHPLRGWIWKLAVPRWDRSRPF